jgi:predicted metal-dependent HD superfamily phosphohydrolase
VTAATVEGWCRLLARVGVPAGGAAGRGAGEQLLARWREPHRVYHTADHLADVLRRVVELGAAHRPRDVALAELAAWWHDAVYEPTAPDNEARSADLATTALTGLGVEAGTVAEVDRLVRLTATHDADPADRAAALLCDADLAILASDPDRYAAYAGAVRQEYAAVPDTAFRAGRAAVLAGLLARERLFATAAGHARFERAARRNLAAEIAALTAPAGDEAPTPPAG